MLAAEIPNVVRTGPNWLQFTGEVTDWLKSV